MLWRIMSERSNLLPFAAGGVRVLAAERARVVSHGRAGELVR